MKSYPEKPAPFIKESPYRDGQDCPFPLTDPLKKLEDFNLIIASLDKDRIPRGIKPEKKKTYTGEGYVLYRSQPKIRKWCGGIVVDE